MKVSKQNGSILLFVLLFVVTIIFTAIASLSLNNKQSLVYRPRAEAHQTCRTAQCSTTVLSAKKYCKSKVYICSENTILKSCATPCTYSNETCRRVELLNGRCWDEKYCESDADCPTIAGFNNKDCSNAACSYTNVEN